MTWAGDKPETWRPLEDTRSLVRINPLIRFGWPAVGGISTEAIAGELDGGARTNWAQAAAVMIAVRAWRLRIRVSECLTAGTV